MYNQSCYHVLIYDILSTELLKINIPSFCYYFQTLHLHSSLSVKQHPHILYGSHKNFPNCICNDNTVTLVIDLFQTPKKRTLALYHTKLLLLIFAYCYNCNESHPKYTIC